MNPSTLENMARSGDKLVDAPPVDQVGGLARRGAAWSFLLMLARHAVALATTVVLSRFLTPNDYGLIGMVATVTVFLQAFADMGLSWAVVGRHGLTRAQVDNLFWINAAVGFALWGAIAMAAPALATFFGRAELVDLARVMGLAFAINGLSVQPMAIMTRRMRFRALFWVESASAVAGAACALGMALVGLGYWALVGQMLAAQSGRLIAGLASGGYRPGPPRLGVETWALIKFGGFLSAYAVVNSVGRNFDNVLIGKAWGAEQLGFYSRAYFLMSLPAMFATNALTGVMVPTLSALRAEPARMARAYREAVRSVVLIGLPLAAALFVAAPEVVRLVYGTRWAPVAALLRPLSLAAMVQVVVATSGWLYIATGHGRAMFLVGIAATSVQVAGFLMGIRYGGRGVAISYATSNAVLAFPTLLIAHRIAALRLADTLRAVTPALAATGAAIITALAAGAAAGRLTDSWSSLLAVKVSAGAIALALCGGRPVLDLARSPLGEVRWRLAGRA